MIENWVVNIESLRVAGLTPSGPVEEGRNVSPDTFDADSIEEKEKRNAIPVHTSSEKKNLRESMYSYLDALSIDERERFGGRGVLVWGGIMLGSRTDLHIFDAG
ncbi:hypothetical protein TNCV_1208241 [Trichonephila clavipes]|nr:hypothetical protein TNCV_1208241 [Trichonephila clavipes]